MILSSRVSETLLLSVSRLYRKRLDSLNISSAVSLCALNRRHPRYCVECIEQKMRINLALEHNHLHFLKFFFRIDTNNLFLMKPALKLIVLLKRIDQLCGGILHFVEYVNEFANLIPVLYFNIRHIHTVFSDCS